MRCRVYTNYKRLESKSASVAINPKKRNLELPLDYLASSATWGVEKPDPAFFKRIITLTQLEPDEIAYVGDRLDNDVLPAKAIGMKAVFLERGPWGVIHAKRPEVRQADLHLHSLENLLEVIR
jgi:FMN phosphatase YigB (HAD superfamily)